MLTWIEQLTGFAPDGGSGAVELGVLVLLVGVLAWAYRWSRSRS